jgi:hypothetical protein
MSPSTEEDASRGARRDPLRDTFIRKTMRPFSSHQSQPTNFRELVPFSTNKISG